MVYILDEGSEFDAPIDRIWAYLQSETEHDHRSIKPISMEMQGDNVLVITNEVTMPNMPVARNKDQIDDVSSFRYCAGIS